LLLELISKLVACLPVELVAVEAVELEAVIVVEVFAAGVGDQSLSELWIALGSLEDL